MTRTAHEALAPYADDHEIVRELHDVPPYRVYEARLDGRRAVLKLDAHPRGHADDEGAIQRYVAEETSVPVPAVLAIGDDHFLAEWDDDAPQAAERVDEEWARAVGVWMGTLHEETAGIFDSYGRPRAVDDGLGLHRGGRAEWIEAARDRLAYHREFLATVECADVADAVDEFLREHPRAFDGAGEPVLCHGNVHPEHAATRNGRAVSVIDFEHALIAPGEYDYWRLALPQFEGPDELDEAIPRAFREGYESVRSLPGGFERRRKLHWAVNFVSYVESLYLQENVPPAERPARAARIRELLSDLLDELRAEF